MSKHRSSVMTTWFPLLLAGVFLLGGLAAPCAWAGTQVPEDVRQVTTGANALGMKLLAEVSKTTPGNLFFSPFSIHVAFAMPFAGAGAQTREELATVFGYPISASGLAPVYGEWLKCFPGFGGTPAPTEYEFALANGVWAQQKYPFAPAYLESVKSIFAIELHKVDFGAAADQIRGEINSWVETITRNKIKDLIPEGILNELTRLVLVNAVYFKGKWQTEFPKADTRDLPFFVDGVTETKVPTMVQTTDFGYAAPKGFQILRMPYKGNELAMFIFLPRERTGLPALEATLATKPLADWMAEVSTEEVRVTLPRFKIEAGFVLNAPLQALGVVQAFSEKDANFLPMLDPELGKKEPGLFISAAFHKAFVAVDEEGTEAAAATAVVMQTKSVRMGPEKFTADHPFLFCIVHEPTSTILFMGRVASPGN